MIAAALVERLAMKLRTVSLTAAVVLLCTATITQRFSAVESSVADSRSVRDTVNCLDTLTVRDSILALVKMSVKPQEKKVTLPPDFEGYFVQEFRSLIKIPSVLPLAVMTGWSPCDSASRKCAGGGVMMLGSTAYVTAHPTGTLSRIIVIDVGLTPAFTDSVGAVLKKMGAELRVPYFNGPDSIPLTVTIDIERRPDTVPKVRQLFLAKLLHYPGTFTNAEWPKNAKGPRYPRNAEMAGVEDSVALSFTVLRDGSVAPQSVDVLASHYTDFIVSVFDRLATMHYTPARIGICPVASRVSQRFQFRVP
jgi:hypothetical protein